MSDSVLSKILEKLNNDGIAKCSLDEILSGKELAHFEKTLSFYQTYRNDEKIQKRIKNINLGRPDNKIQKWYEITANEFLGRELTLGDPIMDLYTSNPFIKIASSYLNDNQIRLRNVIGWIHPYTIFNKEIHSQRWHRDQEDFKILKVFILVNDVNENNGPTEFIKETQHGGKLDDITYNMTWLDYHHKPTLYKKIKNAYVKRFRRYKFKFTPPKENFVKATGVSGTVYFVNSNGLHKGGFVQKGERHLLHGVYLRSDAPMIKYNKLRDFNNSINKVSKKDDAYQQLNAQQKELFK